MFFYYLDSLYCFLQGKGIGFTPPSEMTQMCLQITNHAPSTENTKHKTAIPQVNVKHLQHHYCLSGFTNQRRDVLLQAVLME